MKTRCRLFDYFVILLLVLGFSLAGVGGPAVFADDATDGEVGTTDTKEPTDPKLLERDDEYYELLQLFADTLDQIDRNYVKDVSRRELMEAAIQGMISKLDQYSNYIPPDDVERFKDTVESEFGGIGIQVTTEGGELKVISPIVGSPAYKAGLIAGDKIVKIEGKPTKGITLDQAVEQIKGKLGTKVELTVEHPNGETETIHVERAIVRVKTVLGDTRKDDDEWNYFYDDEKKIAYLRVTAFGRHTTEELSEAIKQLVNDGMKGLVLDLRFNPGGLLSSAIEVSDLFVNDGNIVSTEGRNIPKRTWKAHKKGTYDGFPIAVLVNRYSASASEIVSACLQDHKRAVVIGERTWGKGSVQNIINLEGGKSALKLTTAGYFRPSGKNIHRDENAKDTDEWGVSPDDGFEVKTSEEEKANYLRFRRERDIVRTVDPNEETPMFDDLQLNKALEYLNEQLAKAEPAKEEEKPTTEATEADATEKSAAASKSG